MQLGLQAGEGVDARQQAQRQLVLWEAAGFQAHIHADRLLVWRLLAGQLDTVIPSLRLDWRRAFALHLW